MRPSPATAVVMTHTGQMAVRFLQLHLLVLMLYTGLAHARPPIVYLLENHPSDQSRPAVNLESRVLQLLQQQAQPQLQIHPLQLSHARAWELLQQHQNYCALSKIKTAERERFLYFADKPTTIYPPLQLLSRQHYGDPPLDLAALVSQQNIRIGVIASRHYHPLISELLREYPDKFFQLSSDDAAVSLVTMLQKKRLDAVIEFAAIARETSQISGLPVDFQAYALQDMPVVEGYLVCPKKPVGKRLIGLFNQLMAQSSYQQQVLAAHRAFFTADDYQLIETRLAETFTQAPLLTQTEALATRP